MQFIFKDVCAKNGRKLFCRHLTLTSLLVQHNQSPDTSIFTLCIKNHGEEG